MKLDLTANALEVLNFRYLKDGETPSEMIHRIVDNILIPEAEEDKEYWKPKFTDILSDFRFVPNTPALVNMGKSGQLSACFVLQIDDSINSIFDTLKRAAIVHKSGGGTGFDFSKLRPAESHVNGSGGVASGPVSFMRIYDAATAEMKQGGVRRGANMGILRVDHPDILEFIKCKRNEGNFSNFNISIALSDVFMEAVAQDLNYTLEFNGKVYKELPAREVMDEITKSIWINGEPGIIFIDRINQMNPLNSIEHIDSTNPCSEQPLPADGSCNLGHINVAKYWNEIFDEENFKDDINTAVRFLDNMININNYPDKAIESEALYKRRIGLGIMGLADLLLMKGLKYGSAQAVEFTDKLMARFAEYADIASYNLIKERGFFPAYYDHQLKPLPGRRNGLVTTIAPTGSCSIIANCSPGIEPIFKYAFEKKVLDDDTKIQVYHPLAKPYLEDGSDLPEHFVTAADISPVDHIRMQAAVQKHIQSAISKTINASNNITQEEIYEFIMVADNLHLKSLTIYREGSRNEEAQTEIIQPGKEINSKPEAKKAIETDSTNLQYHVTPFRREKRLEGFTWKIQTGRGKLYVTINEDNAGQPVELFAKIGKSGKEDFAYTEAIGRLISLALRSGVTIERIHYHLEGITGFDTKWDYKQLIKSVPDAIAKIIDMEYDINEHSQVIGLDKPADIDLPNIQLNTDEIDIDHEPIGLKVAKDPSILIPHMNINTDEPCPECGGTLGLVEGCMKCFLCGYNKCGG